MRVVAIDPGNKNIGIAISNPSCNLIKPIKGLKAEKFNGEVFFVEIQKNLCSYWNEIETFIIGSGDDNNLISKKISNQCFRILKARTNFNILIYSEKNSSKWSKNLLKKLNEKNKNINLKSHSYSALKLLIDYFEEKNIDPIISI